MFNRKRIRELEERNDRLEKRVCVLEEGGKIEYGITRDDGFLDWLRSTNNGAAIFNSAFGGTDGDVFISIKDVVSLILEFLGVKIAKTGGTPSRFVLDAVGYSVVKDWNKAKRAKVVLDAIQTDKKRKKQR